MALPSAAPGSRLGATPLSDGSTRFLVWAPKARRVEVRIVEPRERTVPMEPRDRGYHEAVVESVSPGALYLYRLDSKAERPDPASRAQPRGVHGPSQVVEARPGSPEGGWRGLPLEEYVLYELHVGTYTPEGTFDAVVPRLDELKELGVTAVELMPVAQFPGSRNWGYDGVFPFAAQDSYGGPEGLGRLVDGCHRRGLAAVLDVVYNHLGPEGNVLGDFGPYFTDVYRTPWGAAVNFDGPGSDEVRRYFTENALHWIRDLRFDALRLDALHAIHDRSAHPFLRELADAVRAEAERSGRRIHLIGESDLNDPRLVRPPERGGTGLDAQWSDDFHHALHALLTGERSGYYADFGAVDHLARAWTEGYAYSGHFSAYRGRRHGAPALDLSPSKFVVFAQNHDQVGNRMGGERLSRLTDLEGLKLAAGTVLLSPYVPLLFMGEEWGETAPFLYFVSHTDPELVEAVRRGRREEFAAFGWQGEVPDPQDEATFRRSKVDHGLRTRGEHAVLLAFHRELLRLRKALPALAPRARERMEVRASEEPELLAVRRWADESELLAAFHFGDRPASVSLPLTAGRWAKRLDSAEERWRGGGSQVDAVIESGGEVRVEMAPRSFAVLEKEKR